MRILLLGYYGFGNAGDEIILSVLSRELFDESRGPLELSVVVSREAAAWADPRARLVNRDDWGGVLRELSRCDVFVLGGGGLLQDATSLRSLVYYLGLTGLARLLGKRVVLLSVGAERLSRRAGRWITARVLSGAVEVWVRDEESARILRDCGVRAPIRLSADPSFLLPDFSGDRRPRSGEHWILIPREGGIFASREGLESAREAARRAGAGLSTLLLQAPRESGRLSLQGGTLPWESLDDLRRRLGEARLVLTERLHGTILCALLGIPVVGFGPEEKVGRFCRRWGIPWRAGLPGADEIGGLAREALRREAELRRRFLEALPALREQAREPVRLLVGLPRL